MNDNINMTHLKEEEKRMPTNEETKQIKINTVNSHTKLNITDNYKIISDTNQIIDTIYSSSDIHIKNNISYYEEYEQSFDNFLVSIYNKITNIEITIDELKEILKNQKNPLFNNALLTLNGDIAHSHSVFEDTGLKLFYYLMTNMSKILNVVIILGNHDIHKACNKRESISVQISEIKNVHLLYKTGIYRYNNIEFGVFSLVDKKLPNINLLTPDKKHIAMYHGQITCLHKTLGQNIDYNNLPYEVFEGYDYVLLGDKHAYQTIKYQSYPEGIYPGSLIQQHVLEKIEHGYIKLSLNTMEHEFIELYNKYGHIEMEICENKITKYPQVLKEINRITCRAIESCPNISRNLIENYVTENQKICKEIIFDFKSIPIDTDFVGINLKTYKDMANPDHVYDYIDTYNKKLLYPYSENCINNVKEYNKKIMTPNITERIKGNNYKIEKLYFSNITSFEKYNMVDFTNCKNNVVNLNAPNSTGKSTLFQIIIPYALYGPNAIDESQMSTIVNQYDKQKFVTIIDIICNNKKYRIIRGHAASLRASDKSKNQKIISTNNPQITSLLLEYDENINDYIILARDNIYNHVVNLIGYPDNLTTLYFMLQSCRNNFLDQESAAQKYDYFANIYNLNFFKNLYRIATEDLKEVNTKIKTFMDILEKKKQKGDIIDNIDNKLENLINDYETIEKNISLLDNLINDKYTQIINYDNNTSSKEVTIESVEQCIMNLQNEKTELIEKLSTIPPKIEEKLNNINNIDKKIKKNLENIMFNTNEKIPINTLKQLLSVITSINELSEINVISENQIKNISQIKNLITTTKNKEKHESLMSSIIKENEINKEKKNTLCLEINNKITEIHKILSKNNKKKNPNIQKLINDNITLNTNKNNDIIEIKNLELEKNTIENDIININSEIEENEIVKQEITNNQILIKEINQHKKEKEDLKQKIKKISEEINYLKKINEEYKTQKEEIEKINDIINELNDKKTTITVYREFICANGIPKLLLKNILKRTQNIMNDILKKFMNISVEFEVSDGKQNTRSTDIYPIINLYTKNEINIDSKLSSGSQKFLINYTIRLASHFILCPVNPGIICFDEQFSVLDTKRAQCLTDFFEYIKNFFDSVFVIIHNEDIKNLCDKVLYILHRDADTSKGSSYISKDEKGKNRNREYVLVRDIVNNMVFKYMFDTNQPRKIEANKMITKTSSNTNKTNTTNKIIINTSGNKSNNTPNNTSNDISTNSDTKRQLVSITQQKQKIIESIDHPKTFDTNKITKKVIEKGKVSCNMLDINNPGIQVKKNGAIKIITPLKPKNTEKIENVEIKNEKNMQNNNTTNNPINRVVTYGKTKYGNNKISIV